MSDGSYQKNEPLTYFSTYKFAVGSMVVVPFGRKKTVGYIFARVPEPKFSTKEIIFRITDTTLPKETVQLLDWLRVYYPSGSGATTQLFVPSALQQKSRAKLTNAPNQNPPVLPKLTKQQASVLIDIQKSSSKSFLVHGETGSGKTRIYLELAKVQLAKGRSVLILTPEISLVPQLEKTFAGEFPGQVLSLHSGLTTSVRNRRWLEILQQNNPLVIIGTRSALFSPLKNIGLIVVDEMHEPAYKQDQAPRYYALRVAAQAAHIHKAVIVYGSATPPIIEYYVATATKTPIIRMDETAMPSAEVNRTVVDLRDKAQFSRQGQMSDILLSAIEKRLLDKEQSLIFLNRRGTARLVLCQVCGWQALCPQCDTSLIYHGDDHRLRCHTCGFRSTPPLHCPECQSDDITYRSIGTKALVSELQRLYPKAVIRRFDTDNLASEQLQKHYEAIHSGEIDILVGTQMLGKGLDLPRLSLVGIVNAETGLSVPDFSSAERSYQLLHQAIGRVGRGHRSGEVIVQSYNPDSPLLQAAIKQDWPAFYKHELAERQQFLFPPFCFLLKLSVSRKSPVAAEQFSMRLHDQISQLRLTVRLNDPTPSFYERSHGRYNWQIVVRAKQRQHLLDIIAALPSGNWTYDLDPINLL